jgi:hypothetical protein
MSTLLNYNYIYAKIQIIIFFYRINFLLIMKNIQKILHEKI